MKSNKMTDDAFLILVVNNFFFICLSIDCFVFVQISSCIYPETPQRLAWPYLLGQIGLVRTDMVALTCPPAELEHCSTILFES